MFGRDKVQNGEIFGRSEEIYVYEGQIVIVEVGEIWESWSKEWKWERIHKSKTIWVQMGISLSSKKRITLIILYSNFSRYVLIQYM